MTRPPRYILWATFGFVLWGIFPAYFKILSDVSPWEIVCHRIVWSFILLGGYILATRSGSKLKPIFADTPGFLLLGLAALLISTNWITYVYSVLSGHVLEVSLAYFISPIFTIMLGVFFFNEKTTPYKVTAILLCIIAILFKVTYEQSLSPYALILAGSFSGYGMVKKKIHHHSLMAFFIETAYLFIPAFVYLIYLGQNNSLSFSWTWDPLTFLLIGLGAITTVPLLIFGRSVKNIDLSIMGFIQYVSPFIVFLLATVVFREVISWVDILVFLLIWVAIALIIGEGIKKKSLKK